LKENNNTYDITGKQAEEKIRLSEISCRTIFENTGTATIIIGEDTTIYLVNTNFEKLFGYSKEEIEGKKSWREFLIKDNLEQMERYHRLWLADPDLVPGKIEIRGIDKYGRVKDLLLNIAAIPETKMCVVSFLDITGHKKVEKDLRLWEERFSVAFNASPSAMAITTLSDGLYIDINKSFAEMTGYQPHEVIGYTTAELNIWAVPEDRHKIVELLSKVHTIRNIETKFRTKSGKILTTLFSAELIILNDTPYIISSVTDITGRKQMEQEIARLDRLHLVGEIAAGIGHEIRNPMTTMRGFLQLLRSKKDCAQYKSYYDLMIEELDRANSIISEFLFLARNKPVSLKILNINHIVTAISPLIAADALITDKYIEMDLSDGIPDLCLNEKEIRQLIYNLTRNGLEAMAPGGKLTIKTFVDVSEVVLAVQDEGSGIEPDVLGKLDIPFFTTKENGTGLGLPVCYSIAARHNATIKIDTGTAGTTFSVSFKTSGL